VWFDAAFELTVTGEMPGPRSIGVVPGWNLIGWTSVVDGDAEADIAPHVTANGADYIAWYNPATTSWDKYIFSGQVLVLTPGKGYFVWSDVTSTIYYG
ncbi:MAG: hypothetical protein QCI38_05690, partial [Candidatus Thermoplasmatota archaeon]|nr:hypothetical protein [Candidatus Thermoplasmatota archaeon]